MNTKSLLLNLTSSAFFGLVVALALPTCVNAAQMLQPFRASYVAQYRGLPVKATGTREITRNSDGSYQILSAANALLVQVAETSRFELREGTIAPLSYQYKRTGLGKNKTRSGYFNWQQMTYTAKGEVSELTPGTLDKLSYQLQLRLDVASAIEAQTERQRFDYIIADKNRRRSYQFEISGRETLSTPLGDLATVRLERLQDEQDKARITQLWLAIDHDFILVRLVQQEQDQGFELNIADIQWLNPKRARTED